MFEKTKNKKESLANHSKWIAEVRDATRTIDQRLRMIELRVTVLESQVSGAREEVNG